MLQFWIWLSLRKHIRSKALLDLLERFGSPSAIYLADRMTLESVPGLKAEEIEELLDKDMREVDQILLDCDNRRISVLTYGDVSYPDRLRYIPSPPIVLYYEGVLPIVDHEPLIGIVGKRKATAYGLQQAKRFGYQLSRSGFIVVSGAAKGIDRLALEGALSGGRPVIGVLGNGTDVIYPRENKRLYEDIRSRGCLISEYPPGSKPLAEHFPIRNRLISGLSLGTLVIEADLHSGAMRTARHAFEQGRDVFAIPGCIGMPTFEGNHRLIKENAYLVDSSLDFVQMYQQAYPSVTDYEPGVFGNMPVETAALTDSVDKKSIDKQNMTNYIDISTALSNASDDEAAILKYLANGEAYVDDLIEAVQLTPSSVLAAITTLEIRKLVRRRPGNRFALYEAE